MDESKALTLMRAAIKKAGSQTNFAKQLGVTPQYISDVLRGKTPMSDRILQALGLTRTVEIRRA